MGLLLFSNVWELGIAPKKQKIAAWELTISTQPRAVDSVGDIHLPNFPFAWSINIPSQQQNSKLEYSQLLPGLIRPLLHSVGATIQQILKRLLCGSWSPDTIPTAQSSPAIAGDCWNAVVKHLSVEHWVVHCGNVGVGVGRLEPSCPCHQLSCFPSR